MGDCIRLDAMCSRNVFLAILSALLYAQCSPDGPTKVPLQYIYRKELAASKETRDGCALMRWKGMDADGMAGYPWLTTVTCEAGSSYTASGVNLHGHVRLYLRAGKMTVNNHTLDVIGSAYWINTGARAEIVIEGSVYIVGAIFALADIPEAVFTSSYQASTSR